jgi:hypothetical protein
MARKRSPQKSPRSILKFAISWTILTHMSCAVWVTPRELFEQLGRRYCFYNFKVFCVFIGTLHKNRFLVRRPNPWTKGRPYQYRRVDGLTMVDYRIGKNQIMVNCRTENLGAERVVEQIT